MTKSMGSALEPQEDSFITPDFEMSYLNLRCIFRILIGAVWIHWGAHVSRYLVALGLCHVMKAGMNALLLTSCL